jgi:CheY-like chemotaxis protein
VLVVDDNIDAVDMLVHTLEDLGCQTETAFDGPSALEAAKRFRPRVVLLDIGLPLMDGYEVARRLRQEPQLAPLKLVALTGYGESSDRQKSREAGFDEHVVKPVEIDKVPDLIDYGKPSDDSARIGTDTSGLEH